MHGSTRLTFYKIDMPEKKYENSHYRNIHTVSKKERDESDDENVKARLYSNFFP